MASIYHSTSPYAYVRNNPISRTDFLGLWEDDDERGDVDDEGQGSGAEPGPWSEYGLDDEESQYDWGYDLDIGNTFDQEMFDGDDWDPTDDNRHDNDPTDDSSSSWATYVAGIILTAEDLYNNFVHDHKGYTTTGGNYKQYSSYKSKNKFTINAQKQFAKSTRVKIWGNIGTLFALVQSINNYRKGDNSVINKVDGAISIIGLAGSGLSHFGYSNPITGTIVSLYFTARIFIDMQIYKNQNPIMNNGGTSNPGNLFIFFKE